MAKSPGQKQLDAAVETLKGEGTSSVTITTTYDDNGKPHHNTRLSLIPDAARGVIDAHIIVDSVAEITKQWQKGAGKK